MGSGHVIDFTDRTFSDFFNEHGVKIDNSQFSIEGSSKAKRLRFFLKNSESPLIEWRPDGISLEDLEGYKKIVLRLGGELSDSSNNNSDVKESTESELLNHVFQPEIFSKLPVESAMSQVLVARLKEAQLCLENGAYLSAVILCGSVLEGMCLGFGNRHAERLNRAYELYYKKKPDKFHNWKLNEWIVTLGKLGDLSPNIEKFGHAVRDFRNYVHPYEQLAHRFSPDHHTARICFQVVIAAAEDLVRAEAMITKMVAS